MKSGLRGTGKIIRMLNYCEEFLIAYSLLGLGVTIVIAVIYRKLGIQGFWWLEETSRHVLIFATFLGASLAVKYNQHIRMGSLIESLNGFPQLLLKALVSLFCFVFISWLDFYAWRHVFNLQELGLKTATFQFPSYIVYLPISVFCIFIALRYLLDFIKYLALFRSQEAKT